MHGIDPKSWEVKVLPLPKRHSRGTAYGFCGGHPVGRAETARAVTMGCWWPDGVAEQLTFDGQKYVTASSARGDLIPGHWRHPTSGAMGALIWERKAGRLVAREVHDAAYESSWGMTAGGGVALGAASPRSTPGVRAKQVGLVWREGKPPLVITAAGEVNLHATDGTRLGGSIDGRAALWPSPTSAPIDLAPARLPMSEIQAIDGDLQVGMAFKGFGSRPGIWRGSAASFIDLTPKGFETGSAYDGTAGYQVGFVRRKENTRNGSSGCDNIAAIWQGAADRWLDLNALLPAKKYNASVAWAIEISDGLVRVCGEASRYDVSDPGTPRESHFVPVAHPVLWTARLG